MSDYENAVCCKCQRGDKGELLLLCDTKGCTNHAHTFCVGITKVPEGDYYCDECRSSAVSTRGIWKRKLRRGEPAPPFQSEIIDITPSSSNAAMTNVIEDSSDEDEAAKIENRFGKDYEMIKKVRRMCK